MHTTRIEAEVNIDGRKIILICKHYPKNNAIDILGWVPIEGTEIEYDKAVLLDRSIKRNRRALELNVLDNISRTN